MATVPVTRTWVAGEVVLASHFNTNLRDPINFLLAHPMVELRSSAAQSITNGGTGTALTFDTEEADSAGGHSTVSNTSRYTYVYPGWMVWGGGWTCESNATGRRKCWWRKNSTDIAGSEAGIPTAASGTIGPSARTKRIFGNVNDFVELIAWQDSGASRNTAVSSTEQASMTGAWDSN